MTRRIIFIILGALLFLLLLGLVWFWFFRGGGAPATTPPGSFGSGGNKTATAPPASNPTNIPSTVSGGSAVNSASGGQVIQVGGTANAGVGSVPGVAQVPGVDWLGGGGPTSSFVPSGINELNPGGSGGSPFIQGSGGGGSGGGGSNLGLLGAGIAGAGCALLPLFQTTGNAEALSKGGSTALATGMVLTYDFHVYSKLASKSGTVPGSGEDFWNCIARTVGKAVIQQMTNSIVNWINSGFNGQPSFVTNYQQFFSNVGDQAAGEFIKGTALSFLCSPFQSQIKIAIAQSYARRNAQSCTLTGVVKNINSFMNGNFAQGGWAGLLQFTTVPTNNPYGAYAYAQIGLANAQQQALSNAKNNLSPGGFISLQKQTNCKNIPERQPNGEIIYKRSCDTTTATPGDIIEDSLKDTLHQPFLANQLATSFDQIVSALLNQLVTRTLYSGLSNLSGANGYTSNFLTPEQQKAQVDAQALMTELQGMEQLAQQYGSAEQGSISDIQNTQSQLQNLINCWETASSSPALSNAKRFQAQQNAQSARALQQGYEGAINTYNINITRANSAIAQLQELETQVISVTSAADVAAAKAAYQSVLASGALITQADVTQAQQDRTSLQSALSSQNAQTATSLQQCNAF